MDETAGLADESGVFSTHEAMNAGLLPRDLSRLVSAGSILHVCRGWYAVASLVLVDDHPAARRRQLHAATARALVRAFDGRAVASHHTGLVLHDLPIFGSDLSQVHLTRTGDDHSRRRRGLTVHEHVTGAAAQGGVIEPSVAVVQAGMVNGPMAALVAADAALHRGLISDLDLAHAQSLIGGARALVVRRTLRHADGRSESPGETRLREGLRRMGFAVTPQVEIRDGSFLARVDMLLDDAPVIFEFDGFVKYGRTWAQHDVTAPADVVFAEKVREDQLRGLGYSVVRVIWSDLDAMDIVRRRAETAVAATRHHVA